MKSRKFLRIKSDCENGLYIGTIFKLNAKKRILDITDYIEYNNYEIYEVIGDKVEPLRYVIYPKGYYNNNRCVIIKDADGTVIHANYIDHTETTVNYNLYGQNHTLTNYQYLIILTGGQQSKLELFPNLNTRTIMIVTKIHNLSYNFNLKYISETNSCQNILTIHNHSDLDYHFDYTEIDNVEFNQLDVKSGLNEIILSQEVITDSRQSYLIDFTDFNTVYKLLEYKTNYYLPLIKALPGTYVKFSKEKSADITVIVNQILIDHISKYQLYLTNHTSNNYNIEISRNDLNIKIIPKSINTTDFTYELPANAKLYCVEIDC